MNMKKKNKTKKETFGAFTREQWTKIYGPHPDWMWEMLQRNYRLMVAEGKQPKLMSLK